MVPDPGARPGLLGAVFDKDFCGKPATHTGAFGDRCAEHAEELVKALQSPNTLINVLAGKPGMTEAEARKRVVPIQ